MTQIWHTNTQQSNQAQVLSELIQEADAILVGIGAGMSAATGFVYTGPRFTDVFSDFIEKYGFFDMLQAFIFDDWESPAEEWAFMSRFVALNYFDQPEGLAYTQLKELIEDKPYHVITTNADSAFYRSNYDMTKVFRCQGEYGLLQCANQCHEQAYPLNPTWNQEMIEQQSEMKVPDNLIPHCPKCGHHMEINKRDAIRDMVEDPDFHRQKARYQDFLDEYLGQKLLLLEFGVGKKTPQFIREPFQAMTQEHPELLYVTVNQRLYQIPDAIKNQTVRLTEDIAPLVDKSYQMSQKGDASFG